MAKALHRGVHASGEAELPALFRKRHGPCKSAPPEGEDAVATAAPGSDSAPMTAPPKAGAVIATTTTGNTLVVAGSTVAAGLTCDGRKRCTQMRSCEEATWFLQHCPGVEMDGDRDGVPCEQQWCNKR
ncbi:MAG: excalibur calcium-binding domain-containing protein [Rubrivivax sp.]